MMAKMMKDLMREERTKMNKPRTPRGKPTPRERNNEAWDRDPQNIQARNLPKIEKLKTRNTMRKK